MLTNKAWWPWFLVLAAFVFTSIRGSADRCMSVFYAFWIQHYNVEYAEVSAVLGAFYLSYALSGLTIPVVVKRWSLGKWIMLFSLISSISTAIASLRVPFWCVVMLFGAIPGFCFGMQITMAVKVVASVAPSKHRVLAFQLVFMGYGVGPFLACPFWQFLISEYTWSGAMLIISSIYLHIALIGAVMNMKQEKKQPSLEDDSSDGSSNKTAMVEAHDTPRCFGSKTLQSFYHSLDLGMFRLPQTYLSLLFFCSYVSGINVCASYIVPFGLQNIGLSELEASFLPSAIAVGEISAKLIVGMFFHKLPMRWRKLFVTGQFLLGALVLILFPTLQGYTPVLILCAAFGLLEGATDGILVNYLVELFPEKYFAAINAYLNVFGFGVLACFNLVAGVTVDRTGNVSNVFYIGAGLFVVSAVGIFVLLLRHLPAQDRDQHAQHSIVEESSQTLED